MEMASAAPRAGGSGCTSCQLDREANGTFGACITGWGSGRWRLRRGALYHIGVLCDIPPAPCHNHRLTWGSSNYSFTKEELRKC